MFPASSVADRRRAMRLSLGVGVLHIFTGLFMRAVNSFRKQDYMAIFADSLSWILLISGLSMLLLPSLVRHHGNNDPAAYSRLLDWGLRLVVLLAVLATMAVPGYRQHVLRAHRADAQGALRRWRSRRSRSSRARPPRWP